MSWTKQPILEGYANPCLCCPDIPSRACLSKIIAVGFGSAIARRDNDCVADGENGLLFVYGESKERREPIRLERWLTFQDIEDLANDDPDHDWRFELYGPMHGETYQRQGEGEWVLIEKNNGFA